MLPEAAAGAVRRSRPQSRCSSGRRRRAPEVIVHVSRFPAGSLDSSGVSRFPSGVSRLARQGGRRFWIPRGVSGLVRCLAIPLRGLTHHSPPLGRAFLDSLQ
eukprot:9441876-Pyramimonas_sp.AAC.1